MSAFERIEKASPPALDPRATGLTFMAVALVAAVIVRDNRVVTAIFVAAALMFCVVSFLAPSRLKGLAFFWGWLAHMLGAVINPIVMSILFFAFLTPYGLMLRAVRDPLRIHRKPQGQTFWIEAAGPQDKISMERQF